MPPSFDDVRRRIDPSASPVTRRTLLLGGSAALFLAACGSDNEAASTTTPSPTSEPTTTAPDTTAPTTSVDSGFPRTISHTFGDTVVPARPARIACIDAWEADVALALGASPISISYYEGFEGGIAPWQVDHLPEVMPELVRWSDGYDFEAIKALDPDVILGSFPDDAAYKLLSEIAPTIVIDYYTDDFERARLVGAAIGMDDEAAALVADVEAQIAAAKTESGLEGKSIAAACIYQAGLIESINDEQSMKLLIQLGAMPDPEVVALGEYAEISLEQLDVLESDLLLMSYIGELRDEMEANPLFQALDVVSDGRYLGFELDGPLDITRARGVLQIPYVLDQFIPAVKALTS